LKATGSVSYRYFGLGVAIDSDTLITGAIDDNDGLPGAVVYVFVRSETTWEQQALLTNVDETLNILLVSQWQSMVTQWLLVVQSTVMKMALQ